MEFTEQDRRVLNDIWMSQKAKMRLTQMEIVKKLGITQVDFSDYMHGAKPLNITFIEQLCRLLHIDPSLIIPSLKTKASNTKKVVHLQTCISVDGEIQNAYIKGNQVVIEYAHIVS